MTEGSDIEPQQRYGGYELRLALQEAVEVWMERYGVSRETAIYELQRLAAEMQRALNNNRAWRLARLEQALEVQPPDEEPPA
jgi:hypothetical protein